MAIKLGWLGAAGFGAVHASSIDQDSMLATGRFDARDTLAFDKAKARRTFRLNVRYCALGSIGNGSIRTSSWFSANALISFKDSVLIAHGGFAGDASIFGIKDAVRT